MQDASLVPANDRAGYYALHTMVAKVQGEHQVAQLFFSNAKPFLMGGIDQIATDCTTAMCALSFAYYYLFEGDMDRVVFFLSNVKQFVKKNKNPNRSNLLEILYKETVRVLKGEMNVELSLKSFIVHFSSHQNYLLKTNQQPLQVALVDKEEVDKMSSDLAVDKNNFELDTNQLVAIADKFPKYVDEFSSYYPNQLLSMDKYVIFMVSQAVIVYKGTDKQAMLAAATAIAQATLAPYFDSTYYYLSLVVKLAIQAHLEALSTFGYLPTILDSLRLELNALHKMKNLTNFRDREQLIDAINVALVGPVVIEQDAFGSTDDLLEQFFSEFNSDL
jgi:hypothetical protein